MKREDVVGSGSRLRRLRLTSRRWCSACLADPTTRDVLMALQPEQDDGDVVSIGGEVRGIQTCRCQSVARNNIRSRRSVPRDATSSAEVQPSGVRQPLRLSTRKTSTAGRCAQRGHALAPLPTSAGVPQLICIGKEASAEARSLAIDASSSAVFRPVATMGSACRWSNSWRVASFHCALASARARSSERAASRAAVACGSREGISQLPGQEGS